MSLLQMTDITKQFPGVLALDKAQLSVEAGECHALVGENGAGKSTLMKILSGAYQPDSGTIKLEGSAQQVTSPIVARNLGITMIHQELNLLPEMTVAENIFLGHEIVHGPLGWLDKRTMEKKSEDLLESFGQKLSGRALVKKISLAQQQMVEIAKAISVQSKIIIMDEPSAILTDRELSELFDLIGRLKKAERRDHLYFPSPGGDLQSLRSGDGDARWQDGPDGSGLQHEPGSDHPSHGGSRARTVFPVRTLTPWRRGSEIGVDPAGRETAEHQPEFAQG